jgi:hypothetical protein
MRRLVVPLAAVALLAMTSIPVSAAPPVRTDTVVTWFSCDAPFVGDVGVVSLNYFEVRTDGAFADVAVWPGQAEASGDPSWFARDASGSATDSSMTMAIALLDLDGNPVATAAIDATFVDDGPLSTFSSRDRIQNFFVVDEGTEQPLVIDAGSLTIGGDTFDLSGCTGARRTEHSFQSNPNARSIKDSLLDVHCQFAAGDRTVFLDVFGDSSSAFINVNVDPDGVGGGGDSPRTQTADGGLTLAASFDLSSFETGDVVGSGAVSLALAPDGAATIQVLRHRTGWEKDTYQNYNVSGSIDLPDFGISITDLGSCAAQSLIIRGVLTSQKGPSGPTPSNDTPDRAIVAAPGFTTQIRTSGASDGEADSSCLAGPFGQSVPFARTVWYRIAGTGSPITVDTAGSDFDTVVAVYTRGADRSFTEVACDDDVPLTVGRSLQANVTFATEVGVTYWIQAGGWQDEWGRLHLTVS